MVQKIVTIIEVVDKATGKLKEVRKQVDEIGLTSKKTTASIARADSGFKKFNTTTKKSVQGIKQFKFEFLGIMFFGMAIKRVFETLARTTVSTFMKITEGQTRAGMAVNALTANIELLKFSIGNAIATTLMPFIPIIIDITDKISDWIQKNPELVTTLIAAGFAVGTLMFAVGTLALGMQSLVLVMGTGGTVGLIGRLATLGPAGLIAAGLLGAAAVFIIAEWDKVSEAMKQVGIAIDNEIKGNIEEADEAWDAAMENMIAAVDEFADRLIKRIEESIQILGELIQALARAGLRRVGAAVGVEVGKEEQKAFGEAFAKSFGPLGPFLGGFQQGGVVPETGIGLLHKGETVVPAGATLGDVNVTINMTGGDAAEIASEIGDAISSELRTRVSPATTKFIT